MVIPMTDWVCVDELCFDLVSVSTSGDTTASAIALTEAHRHTRDEVSAVILDLEGGGQA